MRNLSMVLAFAILSCLALPVAAEQPQPGPLAKSILLVVKTDRFPQFEEALRQHLSFHRANNDPWAWHTWQIVNGDNLGQYILRTHGHQWQDFDANADLRRSDWADFLANVAPHLQSMSSTIATLEPDNLGQYILRTHGHQWQDFDANADLRRSDWADFLANVAPHLQSMSSTIATVEPSLSRWPAELARPELVSITRFELTYQGFRDFRAAVEKVHAAVSAGDPDRHYAWTRTVNGANGPEMALLVPLAGWADLEPRLPPLSTVIEQLYGAEAATALEQTIGSTVRSISSSVVAYRGDLSYQPAP